MSLNASIKIHCPHDLSSPFHLMVSSPLFFSPCFGHLEHRSYNIQSTGFFEIQSRGFIPDTNEAYQNSNVLIEFKKKGYLDNQGRWTADIGCPDLKVPHVTRQLGAYLQFLDWCGTVAHQVMLLQWCITEALQTIRSWEFMKKWLIMQADTSMWNMGLMHPTQSD
ncbi:uncharacterized protein F5147DRAFT_652944 [Suillus discolor]|uniref:Uncharacterized protein n=1 Tax=Suillus discolor TaxID=1912936 RepID=A0A9P7F799_9AGAM|nr:uncharacterized protein F5147DRAFT_652944 [Suillus discolor]KAG2108222.1 hypothetical protein F5147DRAFT_652944 [Suillus discolor]